MAEASSRPSFVRELHRRRVLRVAVAYAILGWLVVQLARLAFLALAVPMWGLRLVSLLTVLGFPVALVLAWAYDITPEGVVPGPEAPLPAAVATRLRWGAVAALAGVLAAMILIGLALLGS